MKLQAETIFDDLTEKGTRVLKGVTGLRKRSWASYFCWRVSAGRYTSPAGKKCAGCRDWNLSAHRPRHGRPSSPRSLRCRRPGATRSRWRRPSRWRSRRRDPVVPSRRRRSRWRRRVFRRRGREPPPSDASPTACRSS